MSGTSNPASKGERTTGSASDNCHLLKRNGVSDRDNTPTARPGLPEPVSIESYAFEVNKETGRARVVVEYTYLDRPVSGLEGGVGPQPMLAQLPALIYDLAANAVVYIGDGRRTVCATVQQRRVLRWKKSTVKSTGACIVTSQTVDHAEDDGWRIHRFRAIDVFFEVP